LQNTVVTHKIVVSSGEQTAKFLTPRDMKISKGIRIIPNEYGDCIGSGAVGTHSVENFMRVYMI
jgi:hypothetical protein